VKRVPLRSNPGATAAWRDRSQVAARRRERQQAKERPTSPIDQLADGCWFARFDPEHRCEGYLQRCHLVKEQTLEQFGLSMQERWDRAFWVEGCTRHHRRFDHGLIKLSRTQLPAKLERAADRYPKVAARLTRDYGRRQRLIERAA
jgi:hypothetical protein